MSLKILTDLKVQEEGGFGKGGLRRQAQPKAGRNRTARRAPCRPGNRPPRQHPGDTGHSLPGTAQQRPRGAGQGAARFPLLSLQEPRGLREAGPLGCGLTEQLSLACMHRCSSHHGARSPPSRLLAEKPPGSCQAVLHTPAPSARPQRAGRRQEVWVSQPAPGHRGCHSEQCSQSPSGERRTGQTEIGTHSPPTAGRAPGWGPRCAVRPRLSARGHFSEPKRQDREVQEGPTMSVQGSNSWFPQTVTTWPASKPAASLVEWRHRASRS